MLRHAVLLTMLFVPAPALPDDVASDHELIQGTWKLVRHTSNRPGFDPKKDSFANRVTTTIEGNKIVMVIQDMPTETQTFTLFPDKKPKEIDILFPSNRMQYGIYEVTVDLLRINAAPVRPTDFTPPSKLGMLFDYERVKK